MESANLSSKALRSAYLILAFLLGLFTIVATGGGGSGSSGGNTDNEQTITAIVVANPNNVLSVYVDWTTESPMDSEVQFGVNGYQFRIRDDTEVTNHRVLVIGMHA